MIRKIIQYWLGKKATTPSNTSSAHHHPQHPSSDGLSQAQIYSKKTHQIDKNLISQAALKTIQELQKYGFKAYIVGGAVRDLLLAQHPKDFDVATDATPEQVRNIFRRSRIIGRRFRLVHVMFGSETIEVSTFRGHGQDEQDDSLTNASGRIIRDNVFGTIEQDAWRRDFTANALYYDPQQEQLIDFHNGLKDLEQATLRIIGDAKQRYREDPVRMLRAIRLSAKLGLKLDKSTATPISDLAESLCDVPPSRLFDEMLKLFLSGHAVESVKTLRQFNLHHGLLPLLDVVLEQPLGQRFVNLALANTDQRVLSGKTVSPAFLFSTLLWHEVLAAWQQHRQQLPLMPAIYLAMDEVIQIQTDKLAIHKRFIAGMREIWAMQARFEYRQGRRPYALLQHPRFRAAYDFFLLRCESGEIESEIAQWWIKFIEADADTRSAMMLPETKNNKRKRRRKKAVAQVDHHSTNAQSHHDN